MNVPEFILGILTTLSAESIAVIAIGIKMALGDKKKGGGENEKESSILTGVYNGSGQWKDGAGENN